MKRIINNRNKLSRVLELKRNSGITLIALIVTIIILIILAAITIIYTMSNHGIYEAAKSAKYETRCIRV